MSHHACLPALHAGPAEAASSRSGKPGQADHGQIIRFCLPERDREQVGVRSSPNRARGRYLLSKIWKKDSKRLKLSVASFCRGQPAPFPHYLSPPRWFFAGPGGGVGLAGRESLPSQKFTSHVGLFRFYVHQKHNPLKFVSNSYHFRCTFCIYYLIRLHHEELLIILARFHDRAFLFGEVILMREGYKLILVDRIFKDTIIRVFSRVTASA